MKATSKALVVCGFVCLVGALLAWKGGHQPTPYVLPPLPGFPKPYPTNNEPTIEGVELGRRLFYDPILSADSTMACASCHHQASAFSDSPNRFSRGVSGQDLHRNTMPLFNLAWYKAFFWDGKAPSLESQVFHPVRAHDEMNLQWSEAVRRIQASPTYPPLFLAAFNTQQVDSLWIARAIAQFERTLISVDSKYDRVLKGEAHFTPEEYKGFVLVNDQSMADCLHCHVTDAHALGTTGGFANNGLEVATTPASYPDPGLGGITGKNKDFGLFKIPSLRNIALTAPYMHDGRFQTLEEVLDFYSEGVQPSVNIDSKMQKAHRGGVQLTAEEKKHIIAFLHTLTDSAFVNNPALSNPFAVQH